jgi:hypothetical protein
MRDLQTLTSKNKPTDFIYSSAWGDDLFGHPCLYNADRQTDRQKYWG